MDAKKLRTDIIIYALLLVGCAVLFFWLTPTQVVVKSNLQDNSNFTPQTFPNLLTCAIALASAIGLISSLVKYIRLRSALPAEEKTPMGRQQLAALLIPYLTFAIIIVYCVLFEGIGYIWATLIVPPILMFLFGCRKWYLYLVVYGFNALMYVLFRFVLYVPLP